MSDNVGTNKGYEEFLEDASRLVMQRWIEGAGGIPEGQGDILFVAVKDKLREHFPAPGEPQIAFDEVRIQYKLDGVLVKEGESRFNTVSVPMDVLEDFEDDIFEKCCSYQGATNDRG